MFTYHEDRRFFRKLFFCFALLTVFVSVAGIETACAADQTASLDMGLTHYGNKQYDRAIVALQEFLTKHPRHAHANKANYYLAECYIQQDDPEKAFIYLDAIFNNQLSAMKLIPEDDFFNDEFYRSQVQPKMKSLINAPFAKEALFRAGGMEYEFDHYDAARRFLYSFIIEYKDDPLSAWALPYLGDIARTNYDLAIARGSHHVARIYALEAEYYFSLSVRAFKDGKHYPESVFGLAWAEARLGKYNDAAPKFRNLAFGSNAELAENAYYEWGRMLYDQGNYQKAYETLASFRSQYPNSNFLADAVRIQAKSLANLEDYKNAIKLVDALKNLGPGTVTVDDYLLQIRCLYSLGERDRAIKLLTELERSEHGNMARDQINLVHAYSAAAQNDNSRAASILENLLKVEYNDRKRELTFNYFNEPENRRQRGAGRSGGYNGTQSMTGNSHTISQGKLSEESFLKACAFLCIMYATVNRLDESKAVIRAMEKIINEDDLRHAQILETTIEYLAKVTSSPGGGFPDADDVSDSGSRLGSGAVPIPIDPGKEGGLDFGQIVNIDGDDIRPAGGRYDPTDQDNKPSRRPRPGSGRDKPDDDDRYAQNRPNRPNPDDDDGISGTDPNPSYGSSTPDYNADPLQTNADQNRALKNCQNLIRNGNLDEADKRLLAILSNPNLMPQTGAKAAMLRYEIMSQQGQDDEAIVMCEVVVHDYPKTIECGDALWILGDYYEKSGDLDKALNYFGMLSKEFPTHEKAAGATFHLAWDSMENGNRKVALRNFKKIYTDYRPSSYWSHGTWGLAYMYYEDENYKEAKKLIQEVLEHPPDEAILDRVLYLKGKLAETDSDWEVAEAAYRSLMKYCKKSPLYKSASSLANAAAVRAKRNR